MVEQRVVPLQVNVPESFFDAADRAGVKASEHLERLVAAYLRGGLKKPEPPKVTVAEKQRLLIEAMSDAGFSGAEIARRVKVSPGKVYAIQKSMRSPEVLAAAEDAKGWRSRWDGSRSAGKK